MQVVVHIGTHKTGTTSIQHFCASNRGELLRRGIYYPLSRYSPRNLNRLASQVARGHRDEAKTFMMRAVETAADRGADRILISAESLYAMTVSFKLLRGDRVHDYWDNEWACIEAFRSLLPIENLTVVCYLRRQDLFLESIYNQCVKDIYGYAGTIDDFLQLAEPMLDYAGHLRLWAQICGVGGLIVREYGAEPFDLIADFLKHVLGFDEVAGFTPLGRLTNERLGRDVLEFKRVTNRLKMPPEDGFLTYRILAAISEELEEPRNWNLFLEPHAREKLTEGFAEGNAFIASHYLTEPRSTLFDEPDPALVPTYPGLSIERALEILIRYKREMARPGVRAERIARHVVRRLVSLMPSSDRFLWLIRSIVHRGQARRERRGLT